MTKEEFKAARTLLDLDREQMGRELGTKDNHYTARAVRSWEEGDRAIPPAVERLMRAFVSAKKKANAL